MDGSTNVLASVITTTVPGLPTSNRSLYYHDQAANNYAQYYTGGQWVCYQWTDAPTTPVILAGVTHRIDAVLSTGDLLSMEGGGLRLYDPSGSLLVSMPSGNLQFCYEAYIGALQYVFFTLTMKNPHGNFIFNTYAIPTSSMRSLR
jgi:hypothetical protein